MRIIAVTMGEPDSKTRNQEISEMLDYVYAQYELEILLDKTSNLGQKEVEKGKVKYTELVPLEEATSLNKKIDTKETYTYDIKTNPIKAPIKVGDIVGKINIILNNNIIRSVNITVKEDIKKANIFELYLRYMKEMISGTITL